MTTTPIPPTPADAATPTFRLCGCGCDAPVTRRFLPGHDARLKGRLLKAARGPAPADAAEATERLAAEGWSHFLDKAAPRPAGTTRTPKGSDPVAKAHAEMVRLGNRLDKAAEKVTAAMADHLQAQQQYLAAKAAHNVTVQAAADQAVAKIQADIDAAAASTLTAEQTAALAALKAVIDEQPAK